jgi:hypothetical protein
VRVVERANVLRHADIVERDQAPGLVDGAGYQALLDVLARTRKDNNCVATVRVRYRHLPRDASVVVAVLARRGTKFVARESLNVPARLATGTKAYRIPVKLPKGRYTLRASVAVVAPRSTGFSTTRASARQIFRAR